MKTLDVDAGYSPSKRSDKWLKVINLLFVIQDFAHFLQHTHAKTDAESYLYKSYLYKCSNASFCRLSEIMWKV